MLLIRLFGDFLLLRSALLKIGELGHVPFGHVGDILISMQIGNLVILNLITSFIMVFHFFNILKHALQLLSNQLLP
jgi:hypothetical protein